MGQIIEAEINRTSLFTPNVLENVSVFRREEIQLGKVVGRGGFGVVREITSIHLSGGNAVCQGALSVRSSQRRFRWESGSARSSSRDPVDVGSSQRELLARKVWSKRTSRYVLKEVEPTLLDTDKVQFLKGLIDLGLEAYYLGSLNHNHVLKLRGMSIDSASESLGYFIVLDQLQEVLSKKLNRWMHEKRASNGITGVVTGGRKNKERLLMERVLVAYDVADAMEYIHRKKIVFRDLKVRGQWLLRLICAMSGKAETYVFSVTSISQHDNIGFDTDNILKIFDFGLAKELQESEFDEETGLYHMTGMTGALRYMAPEVGLLRPYNQKVDVYSWSMLMWYIMALEPPLGMYTQKMFIERVFGKGYRPALKDKWPEGIKSLIREGWDDDHNVRPDFTTIKRRLKAFAKENDSEIAKLMGDDDRSKSSKKLGTERS